MTGGSEAKMVRECVWEESLFIQCSLTTGETHYYTNFTVPIGCSISQ